jgi:hypothetical protein
MSTAEHTIPQDRAWEQPSSAASTLTRKPSRRLKPEVAARIQSRRREAPIQQLYQKPVDELSPDELAAMRAAFFRG